MGVPLAPVSDMPTATVPLTVAPAAGLVKAAVSGGLVPPPLLLTVTPRVAVAVRPAPSRTVRPSVCAPSATLVVFHANVAEVAVPAAVKTCAPSTVSVNVIGVPEAPVSGMPTLTLPLTVALGAGLVKAGVSVGPVLVVTPALSVPVGP